MEGASLSCCYLMLAGRARAQGLFFTPRSTVRSLACLIDCQDDTHVRPESPCLLAFSLFSRSVFLIRRNSSTFFVTFPRDKFASLILQSFFFFFDISNAGFTRRRHTHEHYRELVSLHLLAYFTTPASISFMMVFRCTTVSSSSSISQSLADDCRLLIPRFHSLAVIASREGTNVRSI